MFGRREWADGDDPTEEQLPIFKTERDRVKMWEGRTWPHDCRSVRSGGTNGFCLVGTGGTPNTGYASNSRGVAPGFWI